MKILFPQAFTLTYSNISNSSYSDWNASTAYAIGAQVYLPDNYGEYKCLVANTGVDPRTSIYEATKNPSGKWLFLGTTNKYKMFDKYLTSQSVRNGNITVEMLAYESQAIYLGNLDAKSVTIQVIDNNTYQVIETFTKNLIRDVTDWLDYYFGDWIDNRKTQFVYERTTATRNISLIIEINNGSSDAKCGIFCCGKVKEVGLTKWGVSVGALDYSTVATDTSTGDTSLLEGNYARTLDIDIFTYTANAMALDKILNDARGKGVVFMAGYSDDLLVYGYKQKHSTVMSGPVETIITVNIIGLT